MKTEEPDDFTREYQRTSAAEAGAPAQATRDAILAEARSAALRRQPAANDSRFVLRAVAGVAVLGVAVLIWRQQDPQMPVDARPPEYTVAQKAEGAAGEAPSAPSPPLLSPAADSAERERRAETQASEEEQMRAPLRTVAPAMQSRASEQSRDADVESAVSAAAADGSALLQETFTPAQQETIDPPASGWLIRDRKGTVLRSGVAASPDELAEVATSAQRDFAQGVGAWTVLPATTAAGRIVDLHVAELR
jgi:hypothetical protein